MSPQEASTSGTPSRGDPIGRFAVWLVGMIAIAMVVLMQLPLLIGTLESGINFEGKHAIPTFLSIYAIALDAVVVLLWTWRRPRRWGWAFVVGPAMLILWLILFPAAIASSGLLHKLM